MLSFAIASTDSTNLKRCIEQIIASVKGEYEIIVNNVTKSNVTSSLIEKYGCVEINKSTNILESRYITTMATSGDHIFLLDDTRLLSVIPKNEGTEEMVEIGVVPEYQEVGGFLDRILSGHNNAVISSGMKNLDPLKVRFILPRYFESGLLKKALNTIKERIPFELFSRLNALDLELIYYETFHLKPLVSIVKNFHLKHIASGTMRTEMKKFYKYGYNTGLLRNSPYKEFSNLGGRVRIPKKVSQAYYFGLLMAIRSVPFTMGYFKSFLT